MKYIFFINKCQDPALSWNKSNYAGLEEIRLPHDKIWYVLY